MIVLFFQKINSKLLILLVWMTVVSYSQTSERNLSNEKWFFAKQGQTNWNPAQVPGTIHTDLLLNKLIPDPFYGTNEKQLQWIENENWEYKTSFAITQKEKNNANCFLQFDGLDTYATIYLNTFGGAGLNGLLVMSFDKSVSDDDLGSEVLTPFFFSKNLTNIGFLADDNDIPISNKKSSLSIKPLSSPTFNAL